MRRRALFLRPSGATFFYAPCSHGWRRGLGSYAPPGLKPKHPVPPQGDPSVTRKPLLAALALGLFLPALRAADEPKPTAPPEPKDMKRLFTKDLDGWDGDTRLWSYKDGIVRGETTKENPAQGNTFLIWRGGELGDFDLRLTFRIKTGNS